jgi:TRAF-interacting protein
LQENICSTPCGHVYHRICVSNWVGTHRTCPQCRKPCRRKSLIQLFLSPNLEENEVPTTGSPALQTQLGQLSVDLNNKINQISGVIENFGLTFSTWGTKNLQLTEQNCELKTQILGMQAENKDLNQKLSAAQSNLAIERSHKRALETLNKNLEKQVQELKTKVASSQVDIKNRINPIADPSNYARFLKLPKSFEPVAKKQKFEWQDRVSKISDIGNCVVITFQLSF